MLLFFFNCKTNDDATSLRELVQMYESDVYRRVFDESWISREPESPRRDLSNAMWGHGGRTKYPV